MEDKKYILTDETKPVLNTIVHRIQAVKDFADVKAGDLGGWIEKEENLSHFGNCWVYDDGCVFEKGTVAGAATVRDQALVHGLSLIRDHASVYQNAHVYGQPIVEGSAEVFGQAIVEGGVISDFSKIYGLATLSEIPYVYQNAEVFGDAVVQGTCQIFGDAKIFETAVLSGQVEVDKNAEIHGDVCLYGRAAIDHELYNEQHYLCVGPLGSRHDFTTFVFDAGHIWVRCGCFRGTIEEFWKRVKKEYPLTHHHRAEYRAAVKMALEKFKEV